MRQESRHDVAIDAISLEAGGKGAIFVCSLSVISDQFYFPRPEQVGEKTGQTQRLLSLVSISYFILDPVFYGRPDAALTPRLKK